MKIRVEVEGAFFHARLPFPTAAYVEVGAVCPGCKEAPLRAVGHGVTHHDHDTYYAKATCASCGERLGEMATTVDTLFGLDEDDAVLHGRPRVY